MKLVVIKRTSHINVKSGRFNPLDARDVVSVLAANEIFGANASTWSDWNIQDGTVTRRDSFVFSV